MDDPQRTTRGAAGPSLLVAVLATPAVAANRTRDTGRADLRTPLRWATVLVALLAAVAANLAGALWAQLEPQTRWGPWTYVALSWLTSALAACAWMPRPWRVGGLALGGLASAAWFVAMLPYAFIPNIGGHFLAAVFLLATAWDEWRTEPTRST